MLIERNDRFKKYRKTFESIKDSIEYDIEPLIIELDNTLELNIEGFKIEIKLEKCSELEVFNLMTEANIPGFDNNYNLNFKINKNKPIDILSYKLFVKVSSLIVKTLYKLLEDINPDVLVLCPAGGNGKEITRQTNICGAIICGNDDKLDELGYGFLSKIQYSQLYFIKKEYIKNKLK